MFIYSLVDPRNNNVFYVGQSKNPEIRLLDHIHKSHLLRTKKDFLLAELIKLRQLPTVNILESIMVDMSNKLSKFKVSERERHWTKEIFGGSVLNVHNAKDGSIKTKCLFCEQDYLKKTKRGLFCTPKCKVYWHRENPKVTLKNFNNQSKGTTKWEEKKAAQHESINTDIAPDLTKDKGAYLKWLRNQSDSCSLSKLQISDTSTIISIFTLIIDTN